jgi:GNAT superfamily N-acetyltransferase
MRWRLMTEGDLAAVARLAAKVHPALPEADAVFAERLRLFPPGCRVLVEEDVVAGYVLSHPWAGDPPALDTLIGAIPDRPATYYLHDLALDPAARGLGKARELLQGLGDLAQAQGLGTLSLVAVSGSEPFWSRHGFQPMGAETAAGYGSVAVRMTLRLPATG